MPVRFARLRIAGFKSFAEPVTLELLPGLTGIVGPNGCGKSNVVEALRWAMGETSAKSLRGGEMDDVIFAGTTARASRNIAEVVVNLEGTEGLAPAPFQAEPELEISRRIERGSGSMYRVNGREIRARDVQTLFADLASGPQSSAMVGQGRVASIVNARPDSRRSLLEEAAGITGLHARRHEAELKLRAAEANLERAEDLRGQLESQLQSLKRQARQANRYRNISGAIRQAEAELLAIQRARVEAARQQTQAALHEARAQVANVTETATAATAAAAEAAARLPPLRSAEAEARTALERSRIAQEQIAAEEQRAQDALRAAVQRLQQLDRDFAHAQQLSGDAAAAEARLAAEDADLAKTDAGYAEAASAANRGLIEAAEAVRQAEAEANHATEAAANAGARVQAVQNELVQAEQRFRRLDSHLVAARTEHERARAQATDPARLEAAVAAQQRLEAALAAARAGLERAEHGRQQAHAELTATRQRHAAAESDRAKLAAEARALSEVLAVKDGERWPPMVDSLNVPPGFEAALGAAIGEELTSAGDRNAARHWRELPAFEENPGLPSGATALDGQVQAPPALLRALSNIGLVPDQETGDAYQPNLSPGQTLVTLQGAVWRWDGYTIRAGAPTQAAVRLQQRNRLRELRGQLTQAESEAGLAEAARREAEAAEKAAITAENQARTTQREAEQELERARAAAAQLRTQAAASAAKLAAIEDQLGRLQAEYSDAEAVLGRARQAHSELPDLGALRNAVEHARAALASARSEETRARTRTEALLREHRTRSERRETIARERQDWAERARAAEARVAELSERIAGARAEHASLEAAPAEIATRRAQALDVLEAAEAAHRCAGDALAEAISASTQADRAARSAEQRLAAARESAVRAEGAAEQAEHAWGVVAERILERLGVNPAMPDPPAELTPEIEEKARKRLERLQKEREEMGPVNLRAETEAEAVETQIAGIVAERDELSAAIGKLRGSIGHLNREGRERLSTVFEQIDRHFQALFTRMFGGGRAHLALVGSDDPLEAGLEIYAQPPGKKLATLSLLSGGEQALTALSLIFAVFRCNPAPVCVLDEVDAPLDDANVERFCNLLEDMVREIETRFIVVTHHPLTMARMDRLYGVTMQERGISRVLSVDLQSAAEMVEPQRVAAE
ncbi:MAG: chromosome segregation protein SMC [Acetobacteraceae bacterium]|nr:chromosome segregation protein SMC [Acetobacteraceae bacterium]